MDASTLIDFLVEGVLSGNEDDDVEFLMGDGVEVCLKAGGASR